VEEGEGRLFPSRSAVGDKPLRRGEDCLVSLSLSIFFGKESA